MQRREAIHLMAGALGLPALSMAGTARAPGRGDAPAARLGPLGIQVYTVREALRADVDDTLARIARIGYRQVEWWGSFGRTPQQIRAALDRNRLTAPSAHFGLEALEGDAAEVTFAAARIMGHHYLVVASVPEEWHRTLDGWRRIAERFNRAGERCRSAGFQFAYHNHDVELHPLEGRVPLDVLCEATDPQLVQMEVDLYWMIHGGADPLEFFRRWPGRVPLVHVKGRTADGHMVDVGAGTVNWRAIFALRQLAGIRHYFVEHDEPADPWASMTAGYRYLSTLEV